MKALFLIQHGCLKLSAAGACEQSVLINEGYDALPAHVCAIKITRTRRDFLAHHAAGYHMATRTSDGREAIIIGATCAPVPACDCEVTR